MKPDFPQLLEDFKAAAKNWQGGGQTSDIFIARYELMLRHTTNAPEDKEALTKALLELGLKSIADCSDPELSKEKRPLQKARQMSVPIIQRLMQEDARTLLPDDTAKNLLSLALDLMAKRDTAGNVISEEFYRDLYMQDTSAISDAILEALDILQPEGLPPEPSLSIETDKEIKAAPRPKFKL